MKRKSSGKVAVSGITPFLWFNGNAEAAARLYVSLFHRSKIGHVTRYGPGGPGKPGEVFVVEFELGGRPFTALSLPRPFEFTEAFSLQVGCRDQAQVDFLWRRLSEGGVPGQCGWLKDRFGVSWQIVPDRLGQLLSSRDSRKVQRVTAAMLTMGKLDIAALERAARGATTATHRPDAPPRGV